MLKDTPVGVGAALVPAAMVAPLLVLVHAGPASELLGPSSPYTKEVPTGVVPNDGAVGPLT